MGVGANGILVHAGILNQDETLTQVAKDLFVENVKQELILGTEGYTPIFPCGPKIQPNPYADMLDLEDEKKFPDFHKNIIKGQYEKIAAAMNIAGGYMILPICDPFALAASLGISFDADIDFPEGFIDYLIPNLPKLAIDLNIMPPVKLAAKLPGLISIPKIPDFNIPPIPNPALDFSPGLNLDLKFPLKIPELILKIIAQIPNLILDLPNLPGAVCKIVSSSGLFSIIPEASIRIVATKIIVNKISEMIMLDAVGNVVGSSPSGITGGLGVKLGYTPPKENNNKKSRDPRQRIIDYATECIDLQAGDKNQNKDGITNQEAYAQRLLYTEYGDGTAKDNLPKDNPNRDSRVIGKERTILKASELSSCGIFVRACAFAGGARYFFKYAGQPLLNKNEKAGRYYDFFADEYRTINGAGIAINALHQAAKTKEALIDITKYDLPALKKGDIIIVYDPKRSDREHVMLVYEDYSPGSFELITVEGGQPDDKNKKKPTAIRKKIYKNPSSFEFSNKTSKLDPPYSFSVSSNGIVRLSGREIYSIIDAEKLCTNKAGTNSSSPGKTIESDIFDTNDPEQDDKNGFLPSEG